MIDRIEKLIQQLQSEETATARVIDLVHWQLENKGSRLLLPAIQRSVVWSNEQVINYWDSLLRGYPAGLMLVHPVVRGKTEASITGRNADGTTVEANDEDFQLFDGQQRMTAVLLGLDAGPMKTSRKLWIDLGSKPNRSSDLKFQLRITSTGQPFGYRSDAPNQKIELRKRQEKWDEWRMQHGNETSPQLAFLYVKGSDVVDAKCAVLFADVCGQLNDHGRASTIDTLSKLNGASAQTVEEFVSALGNKALESTVILQKMTAKIVDNEEEYIRFFGRVGQGGTRLSDDELTYSIIKQRYPRIHDRMVRIMGGKSGRIAGEVDLVLAALRVAKTLAPWDKAEEWEIIGRPSPSFVTQLQERTEVESKFLEMIPPDGEMATLEMALNGLRDALSYNKITQPRGLPAMLLARLPTELVDVLILFSMRRGEANPWPSESKDTLCALVLHWLLFVCNDGKAAWSSFQHAKDKGWTFNKTSVCNLLGEWERNGAARIIPRMEWLPKLQQQVEQGSHQLRSWTSRFSAIDGAGEQKPGEALRVLSTSAELSKRALMWLQREYITEKFSYYDPTTDRDDDLPIDLDHIVPQDVFGFNWHSKSSRLQDDAIDESFREMRGHVGNSLGNYRWLAASENRSRGKGAYVPVENDGDLVPNPDEWNKIIPTETAKQCWSKEDICTFQRLIDLRTLALYGKLMAESGIEGILPGDDK